MPILSCDKLCVGYEHQAVVRDITFAADTGEYLCIVGENGSGKTTLMRTLLGLLPPVSGTLLWEDRERIGVGYLPQQATLHKDFPASVREVILSGCQKQKGIRPFYRAQEKALAEENAKKTGVSALMRRSYGELSGGQRQRVLLARALCAAKGLLLLDEPVAGLDPQATETMYETIDALHKEGTTILMITHDMSAALTRATHILHIGKTVFFGSREAYEKSGLADALRKRREETNA